MSPPPPLKLASSHETGDEGNPKKQRFTVSCQPALGRLPRQQFGIFVDGFGILAFVWCHGVTGNTNSVDQFYEKFSWPSIVEGPTF